MILSQNELELLKLIYRKTNGREKRYFLLDELAKESLLCPSEFEKALETLKLEKYVEVKPFRLGRITHKGIIARETVDEPETLKDRRRVYEKILELTREDCEVFVNIDALAGELSMARYELFDILNYLRGEELIEIHSRLSVSLTRRDIGT